jgi:hypothetical protein
LEREVEATMREAEKLLVAAEDIRDPVTHARVSNRLQDLKVKISPGLVIIRGH